jgi:predicted nucleic-acid-binding Zn-ribbon protein
MEKFKTFCTACNKEREHLIRCEHKEIETIEIDYEDIHREVEVAHNYYQVIECRNCDYVSFRCLSDEPMLSEFDEETGVFVPVKDHKTEFFYPERILNALSEKRIAGVPFMIRQAYREIIDSYNHDQRILCAAGLRVIVEGICGHLGIKAKTIKSRIASLGKLKYLSGDQSESLKVFEFLGNFAIMRMEIPESAELREAISILEMILETLFDLPLRHHNLKKRITQRLVE